MKQRSVLLAVILAVALAWTGFVLGAAPNGDGLVTDFVWRSLGPDSGIFKSTDAGRTWRRLTRGLPAGDLGRIGLAISRKNPRILAAIVEHGFQPAPDDPAHADMTRLGSGVYRSEDGGETWQFLNRHNIRPFFFSQIRINPSNDRHVYVLDVNFWQSPDGGKTLEMGARNFGYDFHAMWIDPNQHDRYYLGQDKGFFATQDHGRTFHYFDNLPVTQYYAIEGRAAAEGEPERSRSGRLPAGGRFQGAEHPERDRWETGRQLTPTRRRSGEGE